MPPEDSAMLVAETLGAQRVAAEPEAAAEIARLCGHLPLALRIATARLRNRPRWTLQYLAERLRDETRRLDELSSGARSVSATLRLSYQSLDEECRNAFSTLALHPGSDMDIHAAGALLGSGARDAEDLLEMLLDVHLVQQPEIGLYTFHDLVRSFAHSLLVESPEDSVAVERLLGYYLTATEVACDLLYSGRRRLQHRHRALQGRAARPRHPRDGTEVVPARAEFAPRGGHARRAPGARPLCGVPGPQSRLPAQRPRAPGGVR